MKPVEQTEMADYTVDPPIRGNCLAACVASIFEVPLAELAGVYDSQAVWGWLAERRPGVGMAARTYWDPSDPAGEGIVEVPLGSRRPEGFTNLPGLTPWIAVVRSVRTPHMHCVVMVAGELAWDPHPLREQGVGAQTGDYCFTLDRPEAVRG